MTINTTPVPFSTKEVAESYAAKYRAGDPEWTYTVVRAYGGGFVIVVKDEDRETVDEVGI